MTTRVEIANPALAIDADAKNAWLPALRDPDALQCTGHLYNGDGYCCLGIFAKSQGADFVERMEDEDEDGEPLFPADHTGEWAPVINGDSVNSDDLLDQEWASQFGIHDAHQTLLSNLNDGSDLVYSTGHHMLAIAQGLAADGLAEASEPEELTGGERRYRFAPKGGGKYGEFTFDQIADVIEKYL